MIYSAELEVGVVFDPRLEFVDARVSLLHEARHPEGWRDRGKERLVEGRNLLPTLELPTARADEHGVLGEQLPQLAVLPVVGQLDVALREPTRVCHLVFSCQWTGERALIRPAANRRAETARGSSRS